MLNTVADLDLHTLLEAILSKISRVETKTGVSQLRGAKKNIVFLLNLQNPESAPALY